MKPVSVSVSVNGNTVECDTETGHLGYRVSSQDSDGISLIVFLCCEFGHTYGFVKCKLCKQYCCSFYGSPLWALNGKGFKALCIVWRKALRMLWRVHHMTHDDNCNNV